MSDKRLVLAGAVLCGMAVALGAFGAHGLEPRVDAAALEWWQTGVQYQMWHGLAVVSIGLAGTRRMHVPAWLMAAGAVVFAGTLYAMTLGAPRWLGAVTPAGGLLLIAGWALLALNALRR